MRHPTLAAHALLLSLLPLLAGCGGAAAVPAADRFAGHFASGFEVESFVPCTADERWWVIDAAELHQHYRRVAETDYAPVFVVVRGQITRRGSYGHLALYDRELRVVEVVDVRENGRC